MPSHHTHPSQFESLPRNAPIDWKHLKNCLTGRYRIVALLDDGQEKETQHHTESGVQQRLNDLKRDNIEAILFRWDQGEPGSKSRGWIREN